MGNKSIDTFWTISGGSYPIRKISIIYLLAIKCYNGMIRGNDEKPRAFDQANREIEILLRAATPIVVVVVCVKIALCRLLHEFVFFPFAHHKNTHILNNELCQSSCG